MRLMLLGDSLKSNIYEITTNNFKAGTTVDGRNPATTLVDSCSSFFLGGGSVEPTDDPFLMG